jgi:hypothetical protein
MAEDVGETYSFAVTPHVPVGRLSSPNPLTIESLLTALREFRGMSIAFVSARNAPLPQRLPKEEP